MENESSKLKTGAWGGVKKIPWFLGRYAFYVVLLMMVVDAAMGLAVFYKYVFYSPMPENQAASKKLIFKEDDYKRILENLQGR